MKLPRLRIHLLTAIILQIVVGVLIWANVRKWIDPADIRYEGGFPLEYDMRHGWPLKAASYSNLQGRMIWYEGGVIVNSLTGLLFLVITWLACEHLFFRRKQGAGAQAS